MDSRGIRRGSCRRCGCCSQYSPSPKSVESPEPPKKSSPCVCGCPPGSHQNLDKKEESQDLSSAKLTSKLEDISITNAGPSCLLCSNEVHFDVNTGEEFKFCEDHLAAGSDTVSDSEENEYYYEDNTTAASISMPPIPIPQTSSVQHLPKVSSVLLCAIEECTNPRHVDANGTVHECCGYTHAMELIRRKTLQQMKTQVVKGVTHCLLPTCDRVTWPFMNYCGKTHAQQGIKMGLKPPPQPKTASQCKLPGCNRPKYIENGKVHDYCGKTHAIAAQKNEPQASVGGPKTDAMCLLDGCYKLKRKDSDGTEHSYCCKAHADEAKSNAANQSVPKDDSLCIIPECTRPKYKDPDGVTEHDCCGKSHAEEAKRRNIQSILTSMSKVKEFLAQFSSSLNVVDIKENPHAKAGGALYKKFITARNSLPQSDRKTCLAFHGTPESNISSICANGYDPGRRRGQVHGPGEYFATTPTTSLSYCKGSKKMLLNELLLGQSGVHHTRTGEIIVMKYPEHDLPRFVITFS